MSNLALGLQDFIQTQSNTIISDRKGEENMLCLKEINPNVKNMKDLDFFMICRRAKQITKELRQGAKKPYQEVINVSSGDPQRAGVKPLTFVRQVLAACLYPQLLTRDSLPVDVRQRAQRILGECVGGSVGSYSDTAGIPGIVHGLSEFISQRDGGIPSDPESIYISPGSQWALQNILNLLVKADGPLRTGVLTPGPGYRVTTVSVMGLGAVSVPYHLDEDRGWELQVEELHRALEEAKGMCHPAALYITNPGNPTGQVQSRKSMEEVIRFASEKKLFLLADEVYQQCVFGQKSEFLSYKRVLFEMGSPYCDAVELASFHSVSKGFMGECGLRAGYVELVNIDPKVMKYIFKLFSKDSCAPLLGQIALDIMAKPPQPGDPSYPLYHAEIQNIRDTMAHNLKRVSEVLNSLPGVTCQPVEGGAFAFPRVHFPPKATQKAEELGMKPDTFYCMKILEEVGLLLSPGCDFDQKSGTHHIRFSVLVSKEVMEDLLQSLSSFHLQFMKEFS